MSFEIVGDLPSANSNIPPCRQELIAAAREHPGQWILYTPAPGEETVERLFTLRNYVDRGGGGFDLGFELKTRRGQVYIRFNPEDQIRAVRALSSVGRRR